MEAIKNNNNNNNNNNDSQQHTASSTIQSAIDDLSKFSPSATTTSKSRSLSSSTSPSQQQQTTTTTTTSNKSALSQIDSTLSSLNSHSLTDAFPYSSEHRARPHSSSVNASPNSHSVDLARSLGRFAPNSHASSLSNLYTPGGIVSNPLTHWNNVGALRNPYSTYGAHRSAQKALTASKDSNNPRKKTYEDKMDKQRLEHILFSGDNSGPLNQQKERMRQKLERKKSQRVGQKKRQSLPNVHHSSNGLLGLNAAKKQKVIGDNGGYFLSEMTKTKNGEKSTKNNHNNNTNNNNKKKNHRNKNNKKSLSKHQRRRQSNKTSKHNKKQPKNRQKNGKKQQQKKVEKSSKDANNAIATKINHINAGYDNATNDDKISQSLAMGESSSSQNNTLLDKQCDIFEQHPDEYFADHNIDELMQNKVKLETLQSVPGISLWRDKKELEPLLSANSRNLKLHKNENPNLEVPSLESLEDEDDDPFVDNFVNVGDSDNENEGGLMMKKSNFSSNSNDSELEIFIDSNERELIRQNEPGYSAEFDDDRYEDINSNVDLIKMDERRRSVVLDSSITDNVNGGFEEVTFDTKADTAPKKVKFVSEEESDHSKDIFENMNVNETQTTTTTTNENENANDDKLEKNEFCMNALNDVLKVAASQNIQNNKKQNKEKEEEREKEEDFEQQMNEEKTQKMNVSATWAKIKNEVKNSQQQQQQNNTNKQQEKSKKNQKNNKKKAAKSKKSSSKNNHKKADKKREKKQQKSEKVKKKSEKVVHVNETKMEKIEKVKESEKASVASPKNETKIAVAKPKKKRKKRKKKKVSQIMNGIDNGSEDERMTVESSSTAPSSTQYQEESQSNSAMDNGDDSGWITKGAKNNRQISNKNKKKINVSSPASSKSSSTACKQSSSSFCYNAVNEKNNKKSPKKHAQNGHKKQSQSHSHSQPKKAKSSNNIVQNRRDRNKTRKERRRDRRENRVNRQKSDPSLLKKKFPSSTIVVPIKHSKTIQPSMIFPKHCNMQSSEPSMKKHHFPALKSSQSQNNNNKKGKNNNNNNNNNNKRDKPPNINLSVLSPPRTISNKSTPTSTPLSVHSDNDYLHTQRHTNNNNARPTRPPITRLQPKKMEAINSPQSPPPNHSHTMSHSKPPLITQRSAPLPMATNSEISTQTMEIINNEHAQSPHSPQTQAPPSSTANSSLIATTPSAGTHVACYLDESGNYKETGLVLPDNIFPSNLPPTSIPLGSFVPNPANNNSEIEMKTDMHTHAPSTPPQQQQQGHNADAMNVTSPQTPLVPLHPLMAPPSAMCIPSTFPMLSNPIPSVALGAIPGAVPILLPMPQLPQFTTEQIANLNKLNININENGISSTSPSKPIKQESVLKPKTASFKPTVSKPIKLEDIKEEDEDLEDHMDDSYDHNDATLSSMKKTVCIKPKSRRECMETLKNDLIAEEREDEWVEIKDLDSTIYPATLWCLHVKSFHAAPECSLKKLQESMSSALHCISS